MPGPKRAARPLRASRDWAKRFFRAEVFSPGEPEALAAAEDEARFIWRALGLRRGQRVLDVACGTGRHDFALARRGAEVVGTDVTPEYLAAARRAGLSLRRSGQAKNLVFLKADMRRLPFRGEFDAAFNVWTSFGYFPDPREDARTLRAVARALKPGGRFLIDVVNADWIREKAPPRHWRRRADGARVLEELELVEGRDPGHFSRWTVLAPGRPPARAEFWVRGYTRSRLEKTLRAAGLCPVRAWAGLAGGRFSRLSPRLAVLAKKVN